MTGIIQEESIIPSELRQHIKAEKLYPGTTCFERSAISIIKSVLTPYIFIAVSIVIVRLIPASPFILAILCFPFMLAAQRCFQTLVHDLSHRLFSTELKLNDMLGNYLVAGWIGGSVPAYRAIHLNHHKYNGSALDPEHIDYEVVRKRGGLLVHCLRYILGLEAFRLIKKYYGKKENTNKLNEAQLKSKHLSSTKTHIFICQLLILIIFTFVANAWYLYPVWLYLAITWNPLLSNLRFLVEHPGKSDLTISTPSYWLEKLYFAPFNFNYHLEHHLWPNIPPYRLAKTHEYLKKQEYFKRHPEFLGHDYINALKNRS